ncbi:hypothetical protein SEVIR_2G421350v4 [Setaria viridis]|uniref:Uncharacterized protein n=1 Tax=Setaria viridis TaxID=4556 RepID=A0A4U6W177_SETVI|nr:hypothetical protein SEVIR_2G421350v2 [Setaria viridis]
MVPGTWLLWWVLGKKPCPAQSQCWRRWRTPLRHVPPRRRLKNLLLPLLGL